MAPGTRMALMCHRRPRARRSPGRGCHHGGTFGPHAEPALMSMIDDVHKDLSTSIGKAHEALKRELAKLRAGRANPSLLEGLRVDYYGTPTPLAQMAHVNVPEARMLTVKPWDKTVVK